MKKVIIAVICVLLCGAIMLCVGVKLGRDAALAGATASLTVTSVSFASAEEKAEWQNSVEALITELRKIDGESVFDSANAFGLFDVNLDGKPELIRVLPGGSAGNMSCDAYDITTGEKLGSFGSGRFNYGAVGEFEINSDSGWCTYYKKDTKEFVNVGIVTTRGGGELRYTNIEQLYYNEELQSYDSKSLLYTAYTIDIDVEDGDFIEAGVSTEYKVAGEDVLLDDYIDARDAFLKNYVRIDEASMRYVRVNDMGNRDEGFAREMTQKLFGSAQEFVKVAED